MERKPYTVTGKAGRYVAGVRRPADGILLLTDSQAAYEIELGSIVPFAPVVPEAPAAADEPVPEIKLRTIEPAASTVDALGKGK